MLSHQDLLEECRVGMVELRAKQELAQLANSPYLDRKHVGYSEYMARKIRDVGNAS